MNWLPLRRNLWKACKSNVAACYESLSNVPKNSKPDVASFQPAECGATSIIIRANNLLIGSDSFLAALKILFRTRPPRIKTIPKFSTVQRCAPGCNGKLQCEPVAGERALSLIWNFNLKSSKFFPEMPRRRSQSSPGPVNKVYSSIGKLLAAKWPDRQTSQSQCARVANRSI